MFKKAKDHDLAKALKEVTYKVRRAQKDEAKINKHLNYPEDYEKGSLSVSVRWDTLAILLKALEVQDV